MLGHLQSSVQWKCRGVIWIESPSFGAEPPAQQSQSKMSDEIPDEQMHTHNVHIHLQVQLQANMTSLCVLKIDSIHKYILHR